MTTRHGGRMGRALERTGAAAPGWLSTRVRARVILAASLLAAMTGWSGMAAAAASTMGGSPPSTPAPSFTPHVAVPAGTGFSTGRLRVALHVKPGCDVVLPDGGDLSQVRLLCSPGEVWLGNLVPRRASEWRAGRGGAAFVPLRFDRQADGFRPYPEGQGSAIDPMPAARSGVRFNLDY